MDIQLFMDTPCKFIQRLVAQNLKGGRVDLKVQTKDGRWYTVSRREGESPIDLDAKGKPTGIVATGGELFRLVFSARSRLSDDARQAQRAQRVAGGSG